MIKNLTILFICISSVIYGQTEILHKYQTADSLMLKDDFKPAYNIFKEIEPLCKETYTLYSYIMWYYVSSATLVEKEFRLNQQFDSSLFYGQEALKLIEKSKYLFDESFTAKEYYAIKNVIVSYFELGQLSEAQKYKDKLYQAYKDKKLPEGMEEYFNFSFFKMGDKNIWGYEWFEELPEDRFSKSFSKIVYYIYSTNPDGTDKDQLYRLQVLMFHKLEPTSKIDYVLTKRLDTATDEVSGTLYNYTYSKDIDYIKLQADIKEVVSGKYKH